MARAGWLFQLIRYPLRLITKDQTIVDGGDEELATLRRTPVVYVMRSTSKADLVIAQRACRRMGLPDPTEPVNVNGTTVDRVLYLEQSQSRVSAQALATFKQLMSAHHQDHTLDVQVVPLGIFWGRSPGQEARAGNAMVGDLDTTSHFRKFWLALFSGRQILVRLSRSVSLQSMAQTDDNDSVLAHKLARVARVHFVRMRHAVAGPKLSERSELMTQLVATPALKKAIADEARTKKVSETVARERALSYIDEIAANYSDTLVRVLDRFMTWMWSRIYNGIDVRGGAEVRRLAQRGHEIIYVPCHRSHMDYLLLSYVIYKEGLVPPHIAAGVNLNFFPAGPIFRRGGAFFIRRSFRGNKLYSAVFREYLCWLFQKGYPVKYFTEGGRSRTGRLLPPKTGMVAMTVQGMLRGQQRPVSIVPVYLGYEHVMEVSTYLKELRGKAKEKESMLQVLGSLRKLKNFGQGYVTFGQPLDLKEFLDKAEPQWRDSITMGEEEPARPKWLSPVVNQLAETLMRRINDAAAANSVNLTSLALLSAEHHALTKEELTSQLDVYQQLLSEVPYSQQVNVPKESGKALWQLAKRTNKFTITEDTMGEVIQLDEHNAIAMTYYRNNVLHMVIVPALVATLAMAREQFSLQQAIAHVERIYPMVQAELFLSHEAPDIALWVSAIVDELLRQGLLSGDADELRKADAHKPQSFRLQLLARAANETLQRYAIVLELLQQAQPIARAELERQSITLAERLSAIHGINAPEFYDKKVMGSFIASLKQQCYLSVNDDGDQVATAEVGALSDHIDELLDGPVRQTIRQSVQHLLKPEGD